MTTATQSCSVRAVIEHKLPQRLPVGHRLSEVLQHHGVRVDALEDPGATDKLLSDGGATLPLHSE